MSDIDHLSKYNKNIYVQSGNQLNRLLVYANINVF
jgi:hypothetical protein